MPFESKPRVRFNKNPLIEVVCQLVFIEPIKGIEESENLVQLHNLIKDKLPLFKKAKSVSLNVNTDNQSVSQIEAPLYEFSSLDESVKVTIEPVSISFVTTDYQSKEIFFNYISEVYNALKSLDLVSSFKRVGLRYRDVIQRSALGDDLATTDWPELLREPLVSVFQVKNLSENILGSQSNFAIKLNDLDKDAIMNASFGIVSHAQTHEQCFMIDCDFYKEGFFEYDNAEQFLSKANIKARDFFQWCIKPKLFAALGPESLDD
jgi:uncharacterized protein (TIGR04255 family)